MRPSWTPAEQALASSSSGSFWLPKSLPVPALKKEARGSSGL
jgi:hypothetical protein